MESNSYNNREIVNALTAEIKKDAAEVIQENKDRLVQIYGAEEITPELARQKFDETTAPPPDNLEGAKEHLQLVRIKAAMLLMSLIEEIDRGYRSPDPHSIYNIGALSSILHFTDARTPTYKAMTLVLHSERSSRAMKEGRWDPSLPKQVNLANGLTRFGQTAKEEWEKGSNRFHHDMVNILLKRDEFADLRAMLEPEEGRNTPRLSRKRLLKVVGKVAEPFGLKSGVKKSK